jgi:adenosylcobinamide-phosphate synthase
VAVVIGIGAVVFVSLVLEAAVGYPAGLHARVPHPVVWVGNAVGVLEGWWNRAGFSFALRRGLGVAAVVLLAAGAAGVGWLVQWGAGWAAAAVGAWVPGAAIVPANTAAGVWVEHPSGVAAGSALVGHGVSWVASCVGLLIVAIVGTAGLAQRSLFDHVRAVLVPMRVADLASARQRVGMIVGRDTQQLSSAGVAAAALESLAESFNDGIVAPAFWFLVAGLPGLFVYKVLNTADSIVGHMEERWRAFGWAAARADDVANLLPARIAGALLVLAGGGRGFGVMLRDARKHASPNAGWPEAAMAGTLGVRLGGPTSYDGVVHQRPVFGDGRMPAVEDLGRGIRVYVVGCGLLWVSVAAVAVSEVLL